MQHQLTFEQTATFNEELRLENNEGLIVLETSLGGHKLITEDETLSGSLIQENIVEGAAASYIILETYNIATIDENSQNDDFELADDTILDFTESNPFGDAGMK